MKKKKDNNLICVNVAGKPHYFTSPNYAGYFLGIAQCSVVWAINHKNNLTNYNGETVTIYIVDGSEIPYKYINN